MFPYTDKPYIMSARNKLHAPTINNNLVPPFVMGEDGVKVNDTLKIKQLEPRVVYYSIYFTEDILSIPIHLWGILPYFPTSKPSVIMLDQCDDMFMITLGVHCNTHTY